MVVFCSGTQPKKGGCRSKSPCIAVMAQSGQHAVYFIKESLLFIGLLSMQNDIILSFFKFELLRQWYLLFPKLYR